MGWNFNDGGRKEAGYKGEADDCGCRAVAMATGKSYKEVYEELNVFGKTERIGKRRKGRSSARTGIYIDTFKKYMKSLSWVWVPTMFIGQGCKVHLKKEELPSGRLIVRLSKHYAAVVDGVIQDTFDPSRNGTRCVYGYWKEV